MPIFLFLTAIYLLVAALILLETDASPPPKPNKKLEKGPSAANAESTPGLTLQNRWAATDKKVALIEPEATPDKKVALIEPEATPDKKVALIEPEATPDKKVALIEPEATPDKKVALIEPEATPDKKVALIEPEATPDKKPQNQLVSAARDEKLAWDPAARDEKLAWDSAARDDKLTLDSAARDKKLAWDSAARDKKLVLDSAARDKKLAWDPAARDKKLAWDSAARDEKLAWDSAARDEKLAWETAARDEKLAWDSATSYEKLAWDSAARYEKLAWDSAARYEKLAWDSAARYEKLAWDSAARDKKLAWDSAARDKKLAWDSAARDKKLGVIGPTQLIVQFIGENSGHCSVLAEQPIPKRKSGIFYYEVTILEEGDGIYIGLATKMPLFVGWNEGTYGYGSRGQFWGHKVPGCSYDTNKRPYIEGNDKFGVGDVIGCGVNLKTRQIIYTNNGRLLKTAGLYAYSAAALFPCVSLFNPGTKIEANFGPKFKFNIAADDI